MNFFLSSYHLGMAGEQLSAWAARDPRPVAMVMHALDANAPDDVDAQAAWWRACEARQQARLAEVGVRGQRLDLGGFSRQAPEALAAALGQYAGVWVTGGNTFALRRAFFQSGFDAWLTRQPDRTDFFYAGYSAGVCVLGPTLHGLELGDVPDAVPTTPEFPDEVKWSGLGLLRWNVVPHLESDHPEQAAMAAVWGAHRAANRSALFLRDGQVLLGRRSLGTMQWTPETRRLIAEQSVAPDRRGVRSR